MPVMLERDTFYPSIGSHRSVVSSHSYLSAMAPQRRLYSWSMVASVPGLCVGIELFLLPDHRYMD